MFLLYKSPIFLSIFKSFNFSFKVSHTIKTCKFFIIHTFTLVTSNFTIIISFKCFIFSSSCSNINHICCMFSLFINSSHCFINSIFIGFTFLRSCLFSISITHSVCFRVNLKESFTSITFFKSICSLVHKFRQCVTTTSFHNSITLSIITNNFLRIIISSDTFCSFSSSPVLYSSLTIRKCR